MIHLPRAALATTSRSPHYADQTELFSHQRWLPDRFCPAQIMADPHPQVTTVTS